MKYCGSLDPVKNLEVVKQLFAAIKKSKVEFDFIAYRGNSGALLAGPLSLMLKKRLVCVRKHIERSHGDPVEGVAEGKYIIVDDFIVYGGTVYAIIASLNLCECVGIYLTRYSFEFCSNEYGGVPVYYGKEIEIEQR